MKLSVHAFQDIPTLELVINENNIVHVTGESGCGKSSIFEAIYWCLYGTVKDVERRGSEKQRMYVCCDFGDAAVYRQRNEKLLTFTSAGKTYENAIAQQKIVEYLGADKDGWLASSYVMQGEPHFLLTLPPRERYNVLLRMSMKGEDAEFYIKKLTERIKQSGELLKQKEQDYTYKSAKYVRLSEGKKIGAILSEEECERIRSRIAKLKEQLTTLKQELDKTKESESKAEMLQQTIKRAENQMGMLDRYNAEDFKLLSEQYDLWICKEGLLNEKAALEVDIRQKQSLLSGITYIPLDYEVTFESIASVEFLEKNIHKNKELASQLNVLYNAEALQEEKVRLGELLVMQEKNTLYVLADKKIKEKEALAQELQKKPEISKDANATKLQELKMKLQALETDLNEKTADVRIRVSKQLTEKLQALAKSQQEAVQIDYEELLQTAEKEFQVRYAEVELTRKNCEAKLQLLLQSQEVHSCPYCTASIRYVNGKLKKSEFLPFDKEAYTREKQRKKDCEAELYRLTNELKQRKQTLLKERRNLEEKCVKEEKIERERLINGNTQEQNRVLESLNEEYRRQKEELLQLQIYHNDIQKKWLHLAKQEEKYLQLEADLLALPQLPKYYQTMKVYTTSEVQKLKRRLSDVSAVDYYELPLVSSKQLKENMQYKKMKSDLQQNEEALTAVQKQLQPLAECRSVFVTELWDYRKCLEKKEHLIQQLINYKEDYKSLNINRSSSVIAEKISKLETIRVQLKRKLVKSAESAVLTDKYKKLEQLYNEHQELHLKCFNLQRLQTVVQNAIISSLMGIIKVTNRYLVHACAKLFKEPIEIRLSTEKLLKGGGKKQEINLAVQYKGGFVHNFKKGLSGGEKARINTALSLALSTYTNSNVLILDEAVSFLDDEIAQKLMELVRENERKVVLLASQNCSSGLADAVVEYNSLIA